MLLSFHHMLCWQVSLLYWEFQHRPGQTSQRNMLHRGLLNDLTHPSAVTRHKMSPIMEPGCTGAVCSVAFSLFPVVTWMTRNFLSSPVQFMIHHPDRPWLREQAKGNSITFIADFDYLFNYVKLVTEPAVERKSIPLSSCSAKYFFGTLPSGLMLVEWS